jgi:hypothetical protein
MFSAQPAPRRGADGRVVDISPGAPPPWARPPADPTVGEDRVWRHAVHVGLFSLEAAYALLARVFPPADDDRYAPPTRGEAALAAFIADEHGLPVEGTLVLSECAWAIGRVLAEGRDGHIADGFGEAQAEVGSALSELSGGALTPADLEALAAAAADRAGVGGLLAARGARVSSYHLDRATAESGNESVLLNSFHAPDLQRVGGAVQRGDYGHALWRYLAPRDEAEPPGRCDVGRDAAAARELLSPERIPAGRWPAPSDEPLAAGQQMAVNEAMSVLAGHAGGIMAVNGPPGTGKTTMLRDLIAAIVVERARHLADLARPEDAFAGVLPWGRPEGGGRRVWRWREHLTGSEIVLACATNAAAENVTTEIPARTAIGEEWRDEAGHLPGLATLVLRAWQEAARGRAGRIEQTPVEAWGLLAACLGSRRRGAEFASAFWWGSLPSERRRAGATPQLALDLPPLTDRHRGLHRALREAASPGAAVSPTWAEAVARFRAAAEAVDTGRSGPATGLSAEGDRLRTLVFLRALELHAALLAHAAKPMTENLRAAMDIITGRVPAGTGPDSAAAAWQSLFMVVPVVSTTFASLPRLFSHLGREKLGWLLVDEAAQVPPQHAVGGIWRARRVVVVGDPCQLEPIVPLPAATQEGLRARHGVGEEWLPGRASVQTLADRVSRAGTRDGDAPGAPWVGVPLTLHRRCEEPMLGIVNAMAYAGRMVNGTRPRPGPPLPPSAWLDVAGGRSEGHWLPAEGERLTRVLGFLERAGQDPGEVLILTPFRDVADALGPFAARWPGVGAGTVHTAQGREADVVILVLGGAPEAEGARRWATARPNLLNVAVSRARRRLWVIGDRAAWARHPHAALIASRLPSKAEPPTRAGYGGAAHRTLPRGFT